MLPYVVINNLLAHTPETFSEIVMEIRNIVAKIVPDATEEIRHGGLVYFFGDSGGLVSAGICGISIKTDHVRLFFTHGAFIPDRKRLLRGTGKAMRYLKLINYEDVPWLDIQVLIGEHANFDPRSFTVH
jgi:hypothetical protein